LKEAFVDGSASFTVSHDGSSTTVSVKCLVDMVTIGYDIKQSADQAAAMNVMNKELYNANGAVFYSLLVTNEYGSVAFSGADNIEVANVVQKGQLLSSTIEAVEEARFGGLKQASHSPHTQGENIALVNESAMGFSVLGYILVGCTVLFLAIYVGVKSRTSTTSETFKPKSALEQVEEQSPVAKKSQVSLADMKKLVAAEDASLNNAMQVGK